MRQEDDLYYSQILNRIRIGSPINEDIEKLTERMISILNKTGINFFIKTINLVFN